MLRHVERSLGIIMFLGRIYKYQYLHLYKPALQARSILQFYLDPILPISHHAVQHLAPSPLPTLCPLHCQSQQLPFLKLGRLPCSPRPNRPSIHQPDFLSHSHNPHPRRPRCHPYRCPIHSCRVRSPRRLDRGHHPRKETHPCLHHSRAWRSFLWCASIAEKIPRLGANRYQENY